MGVSRKNDVGPDGRKLIQEPLWVKSRWIIPPGIGQNGQTCRRCDFEGIVPIEVDIDVACTRRISAVFLNGD
jgi:hypothetical protein